MVMEGAQDFRDRVWESGIYKEKVEGEVRVTAGGMEGDEQADLYNHGGPDNVVLAYDAGHYPVWRQKLEMPELAYGGFGENFTVTGFTDATVCIGDVWIVGGELKLQVTQARQPCFKLARRVGKL
ncbi:MAG TPA: MOSC domain-containing protein, partial [Phycisphaerae bacterium]